MSKKPIVEKAKNTLRYVAATTGVAMVSIAAAHAEDATVSVDLTTGLAGVAVIGGLMASGSLKAVPTYVAWGIKKALSMLR